jgi:hypothetical protein
MHACAFLNLEHDRIPFLFQRYQDDDCSFSLIEHSFVALQRLFAVYRFT